MGKTSLIIKDIGRTSYQTAYDLQKQLVDIKKEEISHPEYFILTEHSPIITIGRKGTWDNIKLDSSELAERSISVKNVNRGGDVTYHGPGQIVGYLIFNLKNFKKDLKWLLRKYELAFINLLKNEFNLNAYRIEGYTGVWINDKKITAIGIGVRKWVSFHGFAFNVDPNMKHFKHIIPCGIKNKGVTSLKEEVNYNNYDSIKKLLIEYFKKEFDLEEKCK